MSALSELFETDEGSVVLDALLYPDVAALALTNRSASARARVWLSRMRAATKRIDKALQGPNKSLRRNVLHTAANDPNLTLYWMLKMCDNDEDDPPSHKFANCVSTRDLMLAAVKINGKTLQFATKDLQDDNELVLAAVTNGDALLWASQKMKNDKRARIL